MLEIREGSPADTGVVLDMLDDAVRWLVQEGRTGQWGKEPWSENPRASAHVGELAREGTLLLSWQGASPVAAAIFSDEAPPHVPRLDAPELYVHLLVTARRGRGTGAGRGLLDEISRRAIRAGRAVVRVDCWGGGDRRLVSYYERAGFRPTAVFDHEGWPGQVLERRLDGTDAGRLGAAPRNPDLR